MAKTQRTPHPPIGRAGRLGHLGTEQTDSDKAAKQVGTAMDSVTLINNLIAAGGRSEQELKTISRNVEHLKIVINRDVVKNSTEDLAPLNAAIEAGQTFMTAEV
jgi:hypothetical protein